MTGVPRYSVSKSSPYSGDPPATLSTLDYIEEIPQSSEEFLQRYPELKPFILLNVTPTGATIAAGSHSSVVEVDVIGTFCAAKRIHNSLFQDPTQCTNVVQQFVEECKLLSTLRHPHIVQFLGICFLSGASLPALVMERLMTSFHDLLESNEASKPFLPYSRKCSILHNVASGLAYLNGKSPPIIHRDLTAKNILLNSAMFAKVADLGVARIMPSDRVVATMSKAPGTRVYMPPEALNHDRDSVDIRYNTSIDIFSFGVVAIFALSEAFPSQLLQHTYLENGLRKGRSELERRERYMSMITKQLYKGHPLIKMIEMCLDIPQVRPNIHEVLHQLNQAFPEEDENGSKMGKLKAGKSKSQV